MNALYLLLCMVTLKLVVTIHTRTQLNFLKSTYQLNRCKTLNLRRVCRKIKPRNNKLFVSLFDEYDEKCIRALIMAREVAKNNNEKEILLKHLLIAIIRIDSNLVKHILNFFNISLTTFLEKLNKEINKKGGETSLQTKQDEQNGSPGGDIPRQAGIEIQETPTNQHHADGRSNDVVEGERTYQSNDQDGEHKLMNTFINKHIQDIEDKINQLKNIDKGQSDISREVYDSDNSVEGSDERDETTRNLIHDAAKRVLGNHSGDLEDAPDGPPLLDPENGDQLPDELSSDLSKELSRQLPRDLPNGLPNELPDEKADIKFSENCKRALHNAVLEARRKKKMFVNVTDILIALINMAQENENCEFLKYLSELNISVNDLKRELIGYDEENSFAPPTGRTSHSDQRDDDQSSNQADRREENGSLMEAIENRDDNQRMRNVNNEQSNHNFMNNLNNDYLNQTREFKNYEENSFPSNNKLFGSSYVKDCLTDMVHAAYEKGDEHFFGRKKEIKRIIEILGRRKKSNPLLIGESGVGKTAIVEHLSYLILKDKVPYHLRNCRIYQLNVGNIVAGTKYRGEFEEKMKHLLSNMNKKKKNILFIDEIHVIVGAGSGEGSLDASNLLKPFLSSDNLQCIGTTTFQEYTKYIEADKALRRRFNCVPVKPFSAKETLLLLKKIKYNYEKYHNIYYTNDALKSIVMLTEDYLPTANFPDKAIDILDEAGAYQKIKYEMFMRQRLRDERGRRADAEPRNAESANGDLANGNLTNGEQMISHQVNATETSSDDHPPGKLRTDDNQPAFVHEDRNVEAENYLENMHMKYVTSDVIENIVSKKSSISYIKKNKKEEEKIIKLKEKLNKIIIGQEKVIDILSRYLFKAITNIKDPNKPIGTLLLCGSSGVGKTLCAQVISKYLFNEDNLIVINMSEYIDKHSVSKLFGSYPGYIGYKEGGELTESVKKKPFSIILFDEIEKAHSEVLHVLLQILDNGMLTDSKGNKVSFKNTFIFMTTNVGSDIITDYFKLYNKNYANLGFKYYLNKKKNKEETDGSSLHKGQLPQGVNSVGNSVVEHPTGLSNNSATDVQINHKRDHEVENPPTQQPSSYELFEEKLRTNEWYEELQPEIEEELKKKFLPEFLNRIDEKIIFRQFLKRDVVNIFQNMIEDLKKRIKKRKNLNLIIEQDVIKYICSDENNIYDMNFGARSIRRALYKYIEDPIASFLISNLCEPNDSIHVSLSNGNKINVQLLKASVDQLVL
ncbi:ATP-dependent Clp protease, putative [Plasmodium knowlesi strain H]|uniref:ATP-dependent Clp protease, putative n=3 Tax=Plasmodium knowlesi TaxID=5850 RepID=A0A5K1U3R4_PLAKH|nr:ATP-dependent Clp protease regulatory subunit ClpC, putative [Plasmodium knowlesi strain H]OTN67701.1 putative ATP-dependent Clp protease [Plasmodium knowlesi]CAA9990540.1 ATP-dependent Clp protease regulatory subunit ClpC, putative [Plasmodium knowlesi strain H]SBO19791.1 ATP-dependent Clp protease, putative [Plasmodium knowlesi strain H]SBO22403.1 ATP-dependent Clp protease, putative [Plasmodium knowlesi strain H]VVS80014.1 ATP-dependent Clp protease regulatory subunit ClpC, putative [Pla|eukprot:XP_002260926.1 ATP-dependent Clp protease, putative [Plasmodium knowlesi strain H]